MDPTIPHTLFQYLPAVLLHHSTVADSEKRLSQIPYLFDIFCLHYRS